MKMILESEFIKVTIEDEHATGIAEVFEMFRGAVLAHTFQPGSLDDLILVLAEEVELRNEGNENIKNGI